MCLAHTQVRSITNSTRSGPILIVNRRAMREIELIKKDAVHLKQRVAEIQTKLSTVLRRCLVYLNMTNSELIARWRLKLKNPSTFSLNWTRLNQGWKFAIKSSKSLPNLHPTLDLLNAPLTRRKKTKYA